MSRSAKSNLKVGKIRGIWNVAFSRMDYFKKSARGRFILCEPFSGRYLQKGPGYAAKQLDRMEAN